MKKQTIDNLDSWQTFLRCIETFTHTFWCEINTKYYNRFTSSRDPLIKTWLLSSDRCVKFLTNSETVWTECVLYVHVCFACARMHVYVNSCWVFEMFTICSYPGGVFRHIDLPYIVYHTLRGIVLLPIADTLRY